MNILNWFFHCILLFLIIFQTESAIQLYHLQISQTNQTFTQTFVDVFQNFPTFSYFIEGATIQNTEFSVTYDESTTTLTSSQIVINFYTYKASSFSASESINIGLLITDQVSNQFSIGVKIVNLSSTLFLAFPNITLVKSSSSYGKLQVYSMCYPFVYTSALNMASSNNLELTITKLSTSYQQNVNIGYIYYNSNYVGDRVIAIFQQINQAFYSYFVPYQPFAFTPSTDNIMYALRQYDSSTIPFMNTQIVQNYNYITGENPQMMLGYSFPSGIPTKFNSDIFFFNSSYSGCSDSQFLYYVNLYQTLPYSCISCNPKCLKCGTNATSSSSDPAKTDADSCTACVWLRYLNASTQGNGNCVCLPGIEQVDGVCQQCSQGCLQFDVSYIQTTNTSNFLLQYSYGTVSQLLPLSDNLQVYINDIQVTFDPNQQEDSYYIIKIALSDMKVCQGINCYIKFIYQYPQYVLIESQSRCLSNNNITVSLDNYIDYYSYVPQSLQQGFNILGIAIGMAFSGGYSSLVTILFEVQQLIDAHRYVGLELPVIFNQFLMNMVYFRFLSILNLMPYSYTQKIQSSVPNDLDCHGPPKLRYYENGLNFYKNTITAFISVTALLVFNFTIYLILKLIPLKTTRRLAKKIEIRKFITIHDTIQQLQLPCMYFALQQLQVVLLHPNLVWIYGMALMTTIFIIVFPFIVVLFIYYNSEKKSKIQIYEDLLQDNAISQKVTYIYYVFNYYRKIFFALCLLSMIPGLVQIYLLIVLNFLHLAFQVYLVVAQTYKSKMKIVIRVTHDICIIAIEVMILLYNLNDYPKDTMVNIGMACLYLTIVSTLMGILDVFVKIVDTCLQQLRSKYAEEQMLAIEKLKIMKEFKNQIKCYIGDELQDRPKDPKQIKFLQDKQLMENTFNKDNQSQQKMSVQLSEKGHTNGDGMDLVFIDDDWMQTYPYETINFKPKLKKQTGQLIKQEAKKEQADVELYEIPQKIEKQAKRVKQNRLKNKKNKYQIDINEQEIKQQRSSHHVKSKQTKDRTKSNSLLVTIVKKDTSQSQSQSGAIQEIISQQ